MALRIAALIKPVPRTEEAVLGPDGRLVREGLDQEMGAFCRRAVSKGIELARAAGGTCVAYSLAPPSAEDCLREAVACGADGGVLISDPAFAGSDTLATAKALAAALIREGPFDLILAGRNSLDSDTGQVAPQVAELLGLPFIGAVRELELVDGVLGVRAEVDDGWVRATLRLPAILSVAERLCPPAKAPPEDRASVAAEHLGRLAAADLGPGPWGVEASPTRVGEFRAITVERLGLRLEGPPADQARRCAELILERQRTRRRAIEGDGTLPSAGESSGPAVAVLAEPGRERTTRELAGAAAGLASRIGGHVVAFCMPGPSPETLGGWGIDVVQSIVNNIGEQDFAHFVASWARDSSPWAILAPSSAWGRHVAARVAAALSAGLTGDAVGLEVAAGRLIAWKPAFGGRMVAAITANTPVQMATVRPGMMPLHHARRFVARRHIIDVPPRGNVVVTERHRDDDPDSLVASRFVVGVGMGVPPEAYPEVRAFADRFGATLAATRKVTDQGWLPHSRQVGLTGASISPDLYLAVGLSGKFTHTIGLLRRGRSSPSTSIPRRRSFTTATSGSWATGGTCCRPWPKPWPPGPRPPDR